MAARACPIGSTAARHVGAPTFDSRQGSLFVPQADGCPRVAKIVLPLMWTFANLACSPRRARVRQTPLACVPLTILLASLAACHRGGAGFEPCVVLVANQQSNSVAVVDLGALRVVRSIAVAPGPAQVVARPHTHQVYAVSPAGSVTVIGYPRLRVLATLHVGRSAASLVFSADGERLYALDPESGEVVFGNGPDGQTPRESGRVRLGGELAGLALAPRASGGRGGPEDILLVTDRAAGRVWLLGGESRQVLGSVEVGKGAGPVVALPDGSRAFVADAAENQVSAVDVAARRVLAHLELASRPSGLLLKPDGGELFVLSADSALLTIVDAFHDEVEQTLPAGRGAISGTFRRDATVLYLANSGDGSVTALDIQTRTVLDSTRAGAEPRALALTPDERYLVVADAASASVAILRAAVASSSSARSALVTTIPVGPRPVDLAVLDWRWEEE
ncbi:MAG TPA: beta-propeller fold lactonase family protein [Terriglobia bacterium]|nr:beta-propeller fold lactonase family protein [Terriglobia bacterium]